MWDSYAKSHTNNRNEKSYNWNFPTFLYLNEWTPLKKDYITMCFSWLGNAIAKWRHARFPRIELKLLRIDDVFKSKLLTFVYESINKLTPVYFHTFFCYVTSIHSQNTRQSTSGGLFLAPRNSLQYGLRSIRYTGAKQWNGLPTSIRFSSSKFLFKKHLKD